MAITDILEFDTSQALAMAILGEPFTAADAAGTALVIAGVGLFTYHDARHQ